MPIVREIGIGLGIGLGTVTVTAVGIGIGIEIEMSTAATVLGIVLGHAPDVSHVGQDLDRGLDVGLDRQSVEVTEIEIEIDQSLAHLIENVLFRDINLTLTDMFRQPLGAAGPPNEGSDHLKETAIVIMITIEAEIGTGTGIGIDRDCLMLTVMSLGLDELALIRMMNGAGVDDRVDSLMTCY